MSVTKEEREPTEAGLGNRVRNWLSNFNRTVPVVVVPVFNAYDHVLECVTSLQASTSPTTPVLVIDDGSTDDRIHQALAPLIDALGWSYVRKPRNSGFVQTANLAFEWSHPRDVVVVNSDVVVPEGWLERLQAAACSLSTIATATPFTNNGTMVSLPYRNHPIDHLINDMTVNQVDARIRAASLLLRPAIPTAIGHCTYFRRSALEAVGTFDAAFSPGYGEEVDFSLRAASAGFCHVLADDVFVYHKGSRSFGSQNKRAGSRLQASHEQMINDRYPWYRRWIMQTEADSQSPLALAIDRARACLLGYRIAIDATVIGGPATGTQILTLELIHALTAATARFGHLSVIIGDLVPVEALCGVDRMADAVIRVSDLKRHEAPFDLIYRPYQVHLPGDLDVLHSAGQRFVVSQLDCISLSSPIYAENYEAWQRYRHLTHLVFGSADGITFISQSAAEEAVQQGLHIPPERACITYVGVDHRLNPGDATASAQGDDLPHPPFILMLGTNFKHKNRVYALKLVDALITKYEWPGRLVFVGVRVTYGGSQGEEAFLLKNRPHLRARVVDLGTVDDAQKKRLLERAALVLYPSVREGFGLIPFEAAAAGTPTLSSRFASLPEILGSEVAYLDGFDPETGADLVWSFLCDPERACQQAALIRARGEAFAWQEVADRTWRFFDRILTMPPRSRQFWHLSKGIDRLSRHKPQARYVPPATNWPDRARRGLYIWRNAGFKALIGEVRSFIRWFSMRA